MCRGNVARAGGDRCIANQENMVTTEDLTPEAEARWQAWLATGRARDVRARHKVKLHLLVLLSGAALVAAFVLGLR